MVFLFFWCVQFVAMVFVLPLDEGSFCWSELSSALKAPSRSSAAGAWRASGSWAWWRLARIFEAPGVAKFDFWLLDMPFFRSGPKEASPSSRKVRSRTFHPLSCNLWCILPRHARTSTFRQLMGFSVLNHFEQGSRKQPSLTSRYVFVWSVRAMSRDSCSALRVAFLFFFSSPGFKKLEP